MVVHFILANLAWIIRQKSQRTLFRFQLRNQTTPHTLHMRFTCQSQFITDKVYQTACENSCIMPFVAFVKSSDNTWSETGLSWHSVCHSGKQCGSMNVAVDHLVHYFG